MDEVDAVLDRLGLELGAREEEIRELREQLYGGGPEQVVTEPASEPVGSDLPPGRLAGPAVSAFAVSREVRAPARELWDLLVDWPRHGGWVPLTRMSVDELGGHGVGSTFVGRTSVGRFGFDDLMTVVAWRPPEGDTRRPGAGSGTTARWSAASPRSRSGR